MARHGMVARWAWMACGAVALVAVLAVSGQIPTGLAAQCEIRPRFRVLAEALPELIGNCVASEALNGETGDIEQPVDGGVLVLRSADNTPVFTDGWQTWVAGPNGIETRLNSERLAWEPGEASLAVVDEAAVVPDGGTLLATRPALDVADMYAGVAPSVVKILVSDGAGSGVRVAAGIVTNAHVVGDETSVTVVLADGQQVRGQVVKVDQVADLALVTTEGWIPELEIERASLQRVGDAAYVVGFPRSSEIGGAASLSRGIISGFRNGQPGVSWIQTDAAMNPGNSGGGLFNGQGKLIGIPSWGFKGAEGLNFAISADTVTAFLARPGSRRGAAPTATPIRGPVTGPVLASTRTPIPTIAPSPTVATAIPTVAPSPTTAAATPTRLNFTTLAAGWSHTCGVEANTGNAWCWGRNAFGQLGDGTSGSNWSDTSANRNAPVAVVGGRVFESLTGAGYMHTCGRETGAGRVWCWGWGRENQEVSASLVSGGRHYCALDSVPGKAYCWGSNSSGQLGDGTNGNGTSDANREVPVAVTGGKVFTSLAAGWSHTCGVESGTGKAWCWGDNNQGQMGNGTSGNVSSYDPSANRASPMAVTGGRVFASLVAGKHHTCGVEAGTGKAWCWGWNEKGQLGDPQVVSQPSPVAVAGGRVFTSLVVGERHTCGLETGTGTAWCWGWNGYGQLGDGTAGTDRRSPVAVKGGRAFVSLVAGQQHTCGLEAGTGTAWCWGWNDDGQLGDGTSGTDRSVPVAVIRRV